MGLRFGRDADLWGVIVFVQKTANFKPMLAEWGNAPRFENSNRYECAVVVRSWST